MALRQNFKNSRALAVVAHPDDETIWLGGFISRHPEMNWTIFSLCRASDPDRRPKFLRVCRHYRAKPIIADLADDGRLNSKQLAPLAEKIIKGRLLRLKPERFDYVFTHGENGEYGHPVHLAAHRAVRSLVEEKKIKTDTLLCFNYKRGRRPAAKAHSDLEIYLTGKEFKNKKAVMTELYGFNPDGIDAGYCTNPEAFKIIL